MTKLIAAKCPSCGADLEFPEHMEMGHCMHCGGKVIIAKPKLDVYHHGNIGGTPTCPNCGNILSDKNILSKCEVCGVQWCSICGKERNDEIIRADDNIKYAKRNNREIFNWQNKRRCTACEEKHLKTVEISCLSCAPSYYSVGLDNIGHQKPTGKCLSCDGNGYTGKIIKLKCIPCGGSGTCPVCNGTKRVLLMD